MFKLPLTTFGYVLTLFYIYLCLFIWLTPKNASESFSGRFLTYGNCLTHDITLDYWLRTITRSAFPHAIFLHHGATRDRTPNRYPLCWTVNYLFSTSLFLLSVEHTARPFTCRPTLHVGFFVLSAFYSVAVTGRVSSAKIKRDNVNRFSHIVSRQKLFFSWRILGKYLIMYLHIEWQRALNGSAFCTGAYLACRLDKRLFFLYSINWYPNFNYPTNYLQVFCAISIIQTTN